MSATIKVEGLEETLKAFDRLGEAGEREAKKATRASLERVRTEAIKMIQRGAEDWPHIYAGRRRESFSDSPCIGSRAGPGNGYRNTGRKHQGASMRS